MADEVLEGTTGTPLAEPETTGTPDDGTTGTLEPEGTTGTPAPVEERKFRLNVGGRDVELTEAQLVESAQSALGHKLTAEERNRELERAREEREFYRRQAFGEAETVAQPAPHAAPAYGARGAAEPAFTEEDTGNGILDPSDPRDRITIETRAEQRQWRQTQEFQAKAARIGQVLQNQATAMAADPVRYPGYDQGRAEAILREGITQGKRMDLFDAYAIDAGRRAPEIAAAAVEEERRKAAGDRARNDRVLGVATAGSGEPSKTKSFMSEDEVKAISPRKYGELKKEGWVPDPRGSGGLVRRAS